MRRLATVLGALATAGALALTVPASAVAASGVLTVGGHRYQNPSGCYNGDFFPLGVSNHTDAIVFVHTEQNCTGTVIAVLAPGSEGLYEFGASVRVR
ncbi:hypothetical protein [Kitasatospora sp. NPDC093806]|uniref:hypothetical protein n=1 Tax=Kitasatospora sp. NPDC093806 TaxID=3155075 RepID=UPI003444ADB7